MCVVVVSASMVNEWQQRDSGRTVPGALEDDPDRLGTELELSRDLKSSHEQPISLTATAHGIAAAQAAPRPSHEILASALQTAPVRPRPLLPITRQQSTPGSIQSRAQPPARQFHRASGSTSLPTSRAGTTVTKDLGGGNEEDDDLSDEDEVDSDDDDDDNDNNDDDNDGTKGKRNDSDLSKGKQKNSSSKAKRFRLTHNQTRFLMGEFARQTHPDGAQRRRLSREIPGLSPRQVQVWFQNRRAKLKRLPAQDREKMMRSRALPEDFDISHTLRSPFATDTPKDYSTQTQGSLFSPSRSSTLQSNESMRNQHSIDTSSWRRMPAEGYIESPLDMTADFNPYLVQPGQGNNPISGTILSTPTEMGPFSYEQRQQSRTQLGDSAAIPTDFSSMGPGSATQLHAGQEQPPQAQPATNAPDLSRFQQSPRSALERGNPTHRDTAAGLSIGNTFEMANQGSATFANLPPEALAYWNTQSPLQPSPEQYYPFHQDLALQASPAPLPQSFPSRAPLQIDTTQPQSNETNIFLNQPASPSYTRTIYNTRQARSRHVQSPVTAYQTPISATLQGPSLQNMENDFLLNYQLNPRKEIIDFNPGSMQAPGVAESYQELQERYKAEHNILGQVPGMPVPGAVYESPYQLSQSQVPNIIAVTGPHYGDLARTAGFGEMPPTPQSAGLKRRYYEENEANPSEVSTSQKRRKRSTVSSAYKSQDPGQEPSI